jgi:hypothetical protein
MNLAYLPGKGDPETWGSVVDPRDPRYPDDDSNVCDYDDPTLDIDDLRCAAKDRQTAAYEAMCALSEMRRAIAANDAARIAVVFARLHDLLEEECPDGISTNALAHHQEWLRRVKA